MLLRELVDHSSPANRARWHASLVQEESMSPTKLIAFRLQGDLAQRLEAYQRRHGLEENRTEAIERLLAAALNLESRSAITPARIRALDGLARQLDELSDNEREYVGSRTRRERAKRGRR
jgi:hypothetical protein